MYALDTASAERDHPSWAESERPPTVLGAYTSSRAHDSLMVCSQVGFRNEMKSCGVARRSAAHAIDIIAGVKMQAFETVDQAASDAIAMLQEGERLSRLWRYVFVQMLDDYTSVLHHAGVPAAARMWASAPRSTGDIRVDAAFAAMAEYLARRDGWEVPSWARLPGREAWPWWFVTDLPGLHPRALVESPSSFRRRGVFITSGALDRA